MEGSRRLDFDYLEKFMAECFMASGTPEKDRDGLFQRAFRFGFPIPTPLEGLR